MAVSNGFLDQIAELLASLGHVTARKMFGGASLYCDGTIFAIVEDDVLYFKGDETSKRRYEDEGLKQFVYEGKTGPVSMPYWREALSASANGARSKTAKTRKAAASVTDGGAPPVKRAKTLAKAPRTSMQKRKTPTR